jgi:hypothetical protein
MTGNLTSINMGVSERFISFENKNLVYFHSAGYVYKLFLREMFAYGNIHHHFT